MLVKQELINKIKDYFDLNIYETKVWLALLTKGIASAGEIADVSGVPRSRTYDVLEGLDKKGFAIVKIGKPVKYIGVKPRIILEKLKNDVKKNAEDKINDLSNIRTTDEYTQLEGLYKSGVDPIKREDISASLKGKTNISSYLREILQEAKKEVIICANADDINLKLSIFKQTFKILNQNNIKIKIALSGSDELIKKISKDLDIKIKKIDVDTKFFIVDRKELLFYLSKTSDKEDMAIWLNSEFFTQAFTALFEQATKGK
ncbi:TrmB family transcriptional regulator [Candidatus Pacearchaeota archaeon]|nr:TrmB family transcriptional regulator [Candidatus Pacearchaeota archaeon]